MDFEEIELKIMLDNTQRVFWFQLRKHKFWKLEIAKHKLCSLFSLLVKIDHYDKVSSPSPSKCLLTARWNATPAHVNPSQGVRSSYLFSTSTCAASG
jgi:hypothetical protein